MTELLAPAGDLERLQIALLYGADAVYIGGQDFSLRANAKNFSLDDIHTAVNFAHKLNKKVYVTVNIVFHEDNLNNLDEYLEYLKSIDVDGIIASDIVVVIKGTKIGLNVILSTQSSTLNYEAVKFWQSLGVKRIVLAREASREDIIRIKEETNVELECFIHGAMCTSMSGKCVLSNYTTNRDSNRGGCAQICRWVFKTTDNPDFTLMSKDLNMVDYIEDMINNHIDSFKVEGRMRSIYYIATVIKCYRQIIDGIINHTLKESDKKYYKMVLDRVANRDSVPQFYQIFPSLESSYFSDRVEVSNQDFLGIVLDYDEKSKIATIEQRNYFEVGFEVEFISPNMETFTYTINEIKSDNDEIISIANHPKEILKMKIDKPLEKYAMMRTKLVIDNE